MIKEDPTILLRIQPNLNFENTNSFLKINNQDLLLDFKNTKKVYNFDAIFEENDNQKQIKSFLSSVIKECLAGLNLTITVYGHARSGKTYTLIGNKDNPGIVPSAISALIKSSQNKSLRLFCSFLCVENDKFLDMMQDGPKLKIRNDLINGLKIENLSQYPIYSKNDF